jgi:glycosyltransferase involved in cell wall biosynthesis
MQNPPLITVICLCYNHEKFVVECLQSVIQQSYPSIEMIIVDDCSTDRSKSIIEEWVKDHPQVRFMANLTNLGNTKSFNKALQMAQGDYIIDLATDDVLLPDCVMTQVNTFQNSTYDKLAVVYGNAALMDEEGAFIDYYFKTDAQQKVLQKRITGDIYIDVLSGGNSICSVTAMIKKEVFDALNGYNENLAYEDLDFWIRASRDYNFDFVDSILIKRRVVTNSLGSQFVKKNSAINYSTYIILSHALQLNRSKEEDLALQKRVHYEIINAYQLKDIKLLSKFLFLRSKLFFRTLWNRY